MWGPIIAAGASGLIGGLFGSSQQDQQRKLNQRQFDAELAFREKQRQDALLQAELERQQRQRENALEATQLDPLRQQRSRQLNALMASLIGHSSLSKFDDPASGLRYDKGEIASFFTPEARAGAESAFNANALGASGGAYAPQTNVGYGSAYRPTPMTPTPPSQIPAPAPVTPKRLTLNDMFRDPKGYLRQLAADNGRPDPFDPASNPLFRNGKRRTLHELLTQGAQ